jgi:hypothetical protein
MVLVLSAVAVLLSNERCTRGAALPLLVQTLGFPPPKPYNARNAEETQSTDQSKEHSGYYHVAATLRPLYLEAKEHEYHWQPSLTLLT